MQQDHIEGGLPLVGEHKIERVDLETGEKLPPSVNQKVLEGSFSTKLTIRCDGQRVRVEGNPSRWQRADNLFGLTSIDDCVAIYNHVLAKYDLPPFTKSDFIYHRQKRSNQSSELAFNGAEITGIDWTVNHQVGSGKEQSFIRGMSSMQIGRGRKPKLYPDGYTCNWGEGSVWMMTKLYCKHIELERNLRSAKRKKSGVSESQLNYINKLIEYCQNEGVVREEHSMRQKMLKRYNLHIYGLNPESEYYEHAKDIEKAMNTIQVAHDEHVSIAHQLVKVGAVKTLRQANTTMAYFNMWQHGTDLRNSGILSQSQFYEHKARLKCIGIDIGQQFDVSKMCPTLRRSEVIDLQPLQIPDWYQMPKVESTNVLPFKAYA